MSTLVFVCAGGFVEQRPGSMPILEDDSASKGLVFVALRCIAVSLRIRRTPSYCTHLLQFPILASMGISWAY